MRIIPEETDISRGLSWKYVYTCALPDGRFEGITLPDKTFDKDQRVPHAAITGNERLSAVLEFIKAQQDKGTPQSRSAGTQRTVYTQTGRRNAEGWTSKLANRAKANAER